MTFGDAIALLKAGERVSRMGWTGATTWLRLIKPGVSSDPSKINLPFIAVATANPDSLYPVSDVAPFVEECAVPPDIVPWAAAHADMLAEDWFVVG